MKLDEELANNYVGGNKLNRQRKPDVTETNDCDVHEESEKAKSLKVRKVGRKIRSEGDL